MHDVHSGKAQARHDRRQMFYMACSELFAYERCRYVGVAHYLLAEPEGEGESQGGSVVVCIPSRNGQNQTRYPRNPTHGETRASVMSR